MPKESQEEIIEDLRKQVSELKDSNDRLEATLTNLIQRTSNDNNDLKIRINSLNDKCSESYVVSGLLREFLARFNSQDIENLKATKTKKKPSKKKDSTINTIETLEYLSKEPETSKYNIYVGLVKGTTDFAEKLALAWADIDDAIMPDPLRVNYLKFYELFISSSVSEDDVPKQALPFRKQIWKANKASKK